MIFSHGWTMPEPTASPLPYAPPPPKFRRRARRIAFGVAIGLLLLLAGVLMPSVLRQARLLRLQRACERYSAPATQVVFEVGPPPTPKSQNHPSDPARKESKILQALTTPQWDAFAQAAPAGFQSIGPILFMHDRRKPSGETRLVVVRIPSPIKGISLTHFPLYVQLIHPAVALLPPRLVYGQTIHNPAPMPSPSEPHHDRYYAGQADPADASHFTITCEINGQPGLIDGWLRDDDSVLLEARKP
jgi:hypothetical protein